MVIGMRKIWIFTQKMMCRLAARMHRQARGNAITTIATFDSWCVFWVLCGLSENPIIYNYAKVKSKAKRWRLE